MMIDTMDVGVYNWWPGVALLVIVAIVAYIGWRSTRGNLPHHARSSRHLADERALRY